ncbi:MAG: DUF1549 domain-containing protein [Bryobacteraceae bacterium]
MILALLLAAAVPDFAQIHAIFTARCTGCHSESARQGGLSLETHAGALKTVTPGNSASSTLMARIGGGKPPVMPLGGQPLSPAEIAAIGAWIDGGAPGPAASRSTGEARSWQPTLALRAPALPPGAEAHPLDRLLRVYLGPQGELAETTDALLLRRTYFDLWGLPPTPEQAAAWAADPSPEKHAALIARLLESKQRYAAHWISFWNDLLRNDPGVVYHGDRKSITSWLQNALESNMPYDRFVQALLNPREKNDPEGFLIGVNWRGDINASQKPVMQAAQNTAQVFLGINLKCNSCHDSFINQWKLKDAYGLASFFSDEPLAIYRCDAPVGQMAQAKFLYPELGGVASDAPLEVKRAQAAKLFTMPENGRTPRTLVNRIWRELFGRGLVEPVDDMDAEPWSADILDWLAADFVAHGWDIQHLLTRIMTSRAYRLASDGAAPGAPYRFRGPVPRRLSAEQFADTVSAITGQWRLQIPRGAGKASYARDWEIKSTALGRALGRPIRDQVFTERQTQPTTLQALELVNGSTLASTLERGSRRLLGELDPAPAPLADSGAINSQTVTIDVPVRGRKKLWLLLEDVDSYDPGRVKAGWAEAAFDQGGPLPGPHTAIAFKEQAGRPALEAKLGTTMIVDVPRGATRFTATVGVDASSLSSDINPRVRFFVFGAQPDPAQLYAVEGDPPVAFTPVKKKQLLDRVYRHALGRPPTALERKLAGKLDAEVLEDTLWAIFLSPEFQFIR